MINMDHLTVIHMPTLSRDPNDIWYGSRDPGTMFPTDQNVNDVVQRFQHSKSQVARFEAIAQLFY